MKRARGESGVALVEFALLLPFLALLVFATLDIGRVYRLQNRLKNASREGAAFVQDHPRQIQNCPVGTPFEGEDAEDRIKDEDPDLKDADGFAMTITNVTKSNALTSCPNESSIPGDRVRVAVKAHFTPITPIVIAFTGSPIVVTGSTEMVVQGK